MGLKRVRKVAIGGVPVNETGQTLSQTGLLGRL
jgi:hypothetical protein